MKVRASVVSVAAMALAGSLLAASAASAGVVINPIFANSFTCPASVCGFDPASVISLNGNADAMAAITRADNQIAKQWSNNMTTNILYYGVHAGSNGFLAASESGNTVYSYNTYTAALAADSAAHPENTILASAVANLASGNGAGDPNAFIAANTTNARALGLGAGVVTGFGQQDQTPQFSATGNFLGGGGVADGVVFLNLDQPLVFNRPVPAFSDPPGPLYDAQSVMEHETDEVMGIGGAGSTLNDANFDPAFAGDFFGLPNANIYGPMDLYRYQLGLKSWDPFVPSLTGCSNPQICSGLPSPYFSVDGGATSIDSFNQMFPVFGGDAADWGLDIFHLCAGGQGIGGTGDLQDAFSCNNRSPDVNPGAPSYKAFEAIGYNPVGTPEPATWAMMLLGFFGLGAALRRRPKTASAAVATL